jgi:hypothetical protein
MAKSKTGSSILNGWSEISKFLGQPLSVAERWAKSGMPVKRNGRRVTALREELDTWLGREALGAPVHIAAETTDLSADLKRGLSYARKRTRKQA